jgi:hypothetical protein
MLFDHINKPGWREQFWVKVDKKGLDDCWEWLGTRYHGKYGFFKDRVNIFDGENVIGKTIMTAHRYSYILHNNEILNGLFVCHHCDNPGCVNPAHLYAADCQRNTQDACDRNLISHAKGSKHGRSVLTEVDVENLYRMYYQDKMGKSEISRLLGTSATNVGDILKGRRWNHLHEPLTNKYRKVIRIRNPRKLPCTP